MNSIRPFVILNAAMTADGKTDTVERRGAAISSPADMQRVDCLRAQSDAIMVGGHTLLGDDPRLTVKTDVCWAARAKLGMEGSPVKVGVVSNAQLQPDSRFLTAGPAPVMIFTTDQTEPGQVALLRQQGAQVFVMGERAVDLQAVLARLWEQGVRVLLVEGGGTLNADLLRLGLVDEIYVHIAPMLFGGAEAPTLVAGPGWPRDQAIHLNLVGVQADEGGGMLVHYVVRRANDETEGITRKEEKTHGVDTSTDQGASGREPLPQL